MEANVSLGSRPASPVAADGIAPAGTRKALVIGGSLGGLFAATALRAVGWDVEVFERSPSDLTSRGGGIVLQPEVVRAFSFAGVEPHGALGVRSHDRLYLGRDGGIRHRQSMPQTQTSWNTLYSALLKSFPAEHYHRNAQLSGVEQNDHSVIATFADGRRVEGDLLIGADGANSTVRQLMLPDVAPTYAGYVVWRGLIEEDQLPDAARPLLYENFVFQHDPGSMMLQYMVPGVDGSTAPGHRRFNWLWYLKAAPGAELDGVLTDHDGKRRSHSVPPGSLAVEQDNWIRRMGVAHANPAFQALIGNTDEIFVQEIQDLQVPSMRFGRVLLTGDAAFVPRPHTAGSTAKAAADAVSLAVALADAQDLDAALMSWQHDRLEEGARMTEWGINMGNRIMGIAQS
ncbi:FAD binding domain-containing protein [Cupriavidus sp. UME77]|uniref:FAD binding domain-containing protein n=1 Tax=Cupriavidus sp. UME77 TaxID=1862321 RepID=UPI0015FF356B|nr:FAD binding domain-containing protein [Cupriavidus sp. UME77]